ncbi:sigma factor-like helix-turn-helix DNA-binding protein [Anaerobacillus alkaliphilus]|nr:sigma factor-like helix-turn-helix DNA-binding protein [Anaerobacillus alkaliphilus]
MGEIEITKEDMLFYLDMIGSIYGPSYKPKIGKLKPYYPFLKEPTSEEYKRFIQVYLHYRDCLNEREKTILDFQYRLKGEKLTLDQMGEQFGISSSRAAQIRNIAELRIAKAIREFLNGKPKKSFGSLLEGQPDEVLIEIALAICPHSRVLRTYLKQDKPMSYITRKNLKHALFRAWWLDLLDHREKAMKILNVKNEI